MTHEHTHTLHTPETCGCGKDNCPVCDWGLGVCRDCGAGEQQLLDLDCHEYGRAVQLRQAVTDTKKATAYVDWLEQEWDRARGVEQQWHEKLDRDWRVFRGLSEEEFNKYMEAAYLDRPEINKALKESRR